MHIAVCALTKSQRTTGGESDLGLADQAEPGTGHVGDSPPGRHEKAPAL